MELTPATILEVREVLSQSYEMMLARDRMNGMIHLEMTRLSPLTQKAYDAMRKFEVELEDSLIRLPDGTWVFKE